MPIYEYESRSEAGGCERCRAGFEVMRKIADEVLTACPECGGPVRRVISAPAIGSSKTGLDDRAKSSGFHKLRRLGKGEYEKEY